MKDRGKITTDYLNKMISDFERTDFEREKDIEERAKLINEQVNFVQQLNLINTIYINEYLARIEKKRIDELNKLNQKEYREQVINFNDDFVTNKERRVLREKEEKNAFLGLSDWKNTIGSNNNSSSSGMDFNKETNARNKDNERHESK